MGVSRRALPSSGQTTRVVRKPCYLYGSTSGPAHRAFGATSETGSYSESLMARVYVRIVISMYRAIALASREFKSRAGWPAMELSLWPITHRQVQRRRDRVERIREALRGNMTPRRKHDMKEESRYGGHDMGNTTRTGQRRKFWYRPSDVSRTTFQVSYSTVLQRPKGRNDDDAPITITTLRLRARSQSS